MELREFLRLLRKERKTFFITVFLIVGGVIVWQTLKPDMYQTIVSLHIARTFDTNQKSDEYRYGDFYRLQADERFGDTIVRWLLSPGIVSDILKESGISPDETQYMNLSKKFKPKRLSSQFIEVRLSTSKKEEGRRIADGMRSILNKRTESLNVNSVEQNGWFVVIVDEPVTYLAVPNWRSIFIFSLSIGILMGVWVVIGKRYFMKEE